MAPEVLHANDSPVQLSSNVMAGMVTLAEHEPGELFAVWLSGQLTVGASLSVTVTVNEQLAMSEAPSVTVRVMVVTPELKVCVPG